MIGAHELTKRYGDETARPGAGHGARLEFGPLP